MGWRINVATRRWKRGDGEKGAWGFGAGDWYWDCGVHSCRAEELDLKDLLGGDDDREGSDGWAVLERRVMLFEWLLLIMICDIFASTRIIECFIWNFHLSNDVSSFFDRKSKMRKVRLRNCSGQAKPLDSLFTILRLQKKIDVSLFRHYASVNKIWTIDYLTRLGTPLAKSPSQNSTSFSRKLLQKPQELSISMLQQALVHRCITHPPEILLRSFRRAGGGGRSRVSTLVEMRRYHWWEFALTQDRRRYDSGVLVAARGLWASKF